VGARFIDGIMEPDGQWHYFGVVSISRVYTCNLKQLREVLRVMVETILCRVRNNEKLEYRCSIRWHNPVVFEELHPILLR
jgi:hypothetical protein